MRHPVAATMTAIAASSVSMVFSQLPRLHAAQSTEAQIIHACALLTKDDIKKLTGRTDRQLASRDEDSLPGGGSSCTYSSTPLLEIGLSPGASQKTFSAARQHLIQQGEKVQPVSGVGDEAYFESTQNYGRVYVRVGQRRLWVSMEVVPPVSAESVQPTVLALAKAAAEKLR